uniref:E2 ubiquitin-conjugating enzyme n=1 Tax=Globisporangium ultimum (strain ATCC 200006 / CBS 805.95 / DAOM BR144) TaxID=431595 RepID=K3W7D8_GLOUD
MTAMRARMRKELEMLATDPPHGVSAWPKDEQIDRLEAQILGPDGSPYEKGVFHLEIEIPERYPFEPPKVRFTTPIYHPNIDDAGRICLDTLKMQPKGSWLPSVNISTLLTTIRLLMAEPNADDGLMPEITDMFKHNRELFNRKATEMTLQHARNAAAMKPIRTADSASEASSSNAASAVGHDTGVESESKVAAAPTPAGSSGKKPLRSGDAVGVSQQRVEEAESDDEANASSENEDDDGLSDFSDDASDDDASKASKRRRTG